MRLLLLDRLLGAGTRASAQRHRTQKRASDDWDRKAQELESRQDQQATEMSLLKQEVDLLKEDMHDLKGGRS